MDTNKQIKGPWLTVIATIVLLYIGSSLFVVFIWLDVAGVYTAAEITAYWTEGGLSKVVEYRFVIDHDTIVSSDVLNPEDTAGILSEGHVVIKVLEALPTINKVKPDCLPTDLVPGELYESLNCD